MSILFSMTTYSARAPYIGATLGSLLAVPDSRIVVSCTPECATIVPRISPRVITESSLPHKDHSYRKYFAYPYLNDDVVFTVDDDHNYQVSDVLAVVSEVRKDPGSVYQARGNGGIFKPGRNPPELKWFTNHVGGPISDYFGQKRQSQIVFGGSLAGYSRQLWLTVRERMREECLGFDSDEELADDYTASRILAKLGVRIWSLPIWFQFPHTQALPMGEGSTAIDPLHRRISKNEVNGNVGRYLRIAKRDSDKGDRWWEPMV